MNKGEEATEGRSFLAALWRYGVVGAGQNAVAYLASLALLALGLGSVQSMAIVVPLAALASFLINRAWTFRTRSARVIRLGRYLIAWALVYPFALFVAGAATHLQAPGWIANLAAIIAAAGPLFLAMRYWVFAPQRPQA
jgi:putative flippase GtrA